MTPYYICYAILFVSVAAGLLLDKLRVATILAFAPMFVLIAGRGMVGTDSAVYVQSFDIIRYQGMLASSFEPGFTLLVEVLNWFFRDSFDVLVVLGSATALIMLCAGLLLERSPLLFLTIVMPFFLIDMTINGLRYGLAFAIVALGAAAFARGNLKAFIACGIIAASVQVSSVLLAVGLWALMEARFKTFIGAAVGMVAVLVVFGSYLEDKVSQNTDISGLGGLSGIIPLVATIAVVVGLRYSDRPIITSKFPVFAILGMQLASFGLARFYYAGLRFQTLFLFLLYLLVAVSTRRSLVQLSGKRLLTGSLLSILVLCSVSRLSNFRDDTGGFSPFNPFYFQRELKG
jgi:hypothetical protein